MAKYSGQALHLADMFSKEHFRQIEETFRKYFGGGLETVSPDGSEMRTLCSRDRCPEFCRLIRNSRTGRSRCKAERKRSLHTASQTGLPHITICHAGIVLGCVPVMDGKEALGGLFFGKSLPDKFDDTTAAEIRKRLRGLMISEDTICSAGKGLDVVSARVTFEAAEFLYVLLHEVTGFAPHVMKDRKAEIDEPVEQGRIKSEYKLIGKLKTGDAAGAKEIADSMNEEIVSGSEGDINLLKAKGIELLSTLTRTAAECGVNINSILAKNAKYIAKARNIETPDAFCAWAREAMADFAKQVYALRDTEKMRRIKPAIEFMEVSFAKEIGMGEIAAMSQLSVWRLGHLFKEQMGVTVIDYLTNIRIDHAKRLLVETDKNCTTICREIGYKNQSYFTRTFKKVVGITPIEFRKSANSHSCSLQYISDSGLT